MLFEDDSIAPTNKIEIYAPIDSEHKLHQKGLQIWFPYGHCINRPPNNLIKFRTKIYSNRKENAFYGNYYSNGISSIKFGIPQEQNNYEKLKL